MAGQVKQETTQPYQERMMESTSQKIERLRNLEQLTKEGDDLLPF